MDDMAMDEFDRLKVSIRAAAVDLSDDEQVAVEASICRISIVERLVIAVENLAASAERIAAVMERT